jgi:hypothetical protein
LLPWLFASALAFAGRPALAEEPDSTGRRAPDGALGFLTGASVFVAGFGAGAVLMGSDGGPARDRAGWLVLQSSFVLAPIAAHGVTDEWTRGLSFAALPAVTMVGTGAVFAIDPNAVRHAPLSEQRVMWGLFGSALFVGAAGVVDAAFAGSRAQAVSIRPSVGFGQVGLEVGGTL